MAGPLNIDIEGIVRDVQERLSFVLSADKAAGEVIEILRDTHRILGKLEEKVDRLEGEALEWQDKLGDLEVSAKRFDRLEEAVLNIERATLSVEAALNAMPKAFRQRIQRERHVPPPA